MPRTLLLLLAACSPLETFDPDALDDEPDVDTEDTRPDDTEAPTRDTSVERGDTATADTDDTDDTNASGGTSLIPPALDGLNLLTNPGGETGDFTGWDLVQSGGDGGVMASGSGHGGTYEFATSYAEARREQTLDLLARGFTAAMLDASPPIHVEDWVREVYCGPDAWTIGIRLLDGAGAELDSFEVSSTPGTVGGCDYANDTWDLVERTLTGYPPGVRSLVFYDGGVDIEFWAGHYGPRFDDASVSLSNP